MDVSAADILLIALGGAIGAVLRFSVGQVVNTEQFPWATFAVNILGTFFLALITFSFPGIPSAANYSCLRDSSVHLPQCRHSHWKQ